MCQPGRPGPMAVSQKCSPRFGAFHKAKSRVDQSHHVVDMVRGAHPAFRRLDAQRLAIHKKCLDKFFCVLANAQAGRGRVGDDAIVHISQVHYVLQAESLAAQEAAQNVLEHERPEIPDVREVVDRGATCIHADFARHKGNEGLFLTGQCVVQENLRHRSLCGSISLQTKGAILADAPPPHKRPGLYPRVSQDLSVIVDESFAANYSQHSSAIVQKAVFP